MKTELIPVEQTSGFLNMTEITRIGNKVREGYGMNPLNLSQFMRSPDTAYFVACLESSLKLPVSAGLLDPENYNKGNAKSLSHTQLITSKRGKGGATYAHRAIALYWAQKLHPKFFISLVDSLSSLDKIMDALNDFEVDEDLVKDIQLYVYVAENIETKKLKIGISRDPEGILANLQTANHAELRLLAVKPVTSFNDVKEQHKLNSDFHIRGEWFTCQAKIM